MTTETTPRVTRAEEAAWEAWPNDYDWSERHAFRDGYLAAQAAAKARIARTLSDHGRMLWRDDVEGYCPSPELCFEYSATVRCSPCAIKQATASGVETLRPDQSYLPEVCRLNRELAEAKAREAELVKLLHKAHQLLERNVETNTRHDFAEQKLIVEIRATLARHKGDTA